MMSPRHLVDFCRGHMTKVLLAWIAALTLALLLPATVHADNCGDDLLNAADCIRTRGVRQGIAITIGIAGTTGVILTNVVLQSLRRPAGATLPGMPETIPPEIPGMSGPIAPGSPGPEGQVWSPIPGEGWVAQQTHDYQRRVLDMGWKWNPASGGFEVQAGAVNEQGQVWYQPPWDEGGPYWVDRSEYDDIQSHLQAGDSWSNTWGWKPREEIRALDSQREERWRQFTDKEAGQRRHEQLMADVRKAVLNDPEYQRVMQELDAIREQLRDIQRQSLRDDIAFHQRMAALHERRDRLLGIVAAPVQAVKTTADVTIDVLGTIPGGPRYIKWGYKAATNFAETSIKTGDYVQGFKAAATATGKEVVGDLIGDKVSIPGVQSLPAVGKTPVKELIQATGKEELKAVGANYLSGQIISKTVVDPGYNAGKNLITGSKDPIISWESITKNPYSSE